MWRRVDWEIVIDISEERNTSVLRVKQALFLDLDPHQPRRKITQKKLVLRKNNA
jgi:hypothetical protein